MSHVQPKGTVSVSLGGISIFIYFIFWHLFFNVCVDRYNHTSVIPCSDVKSKNACYKYLKRKTKTNKNYCLWRNCCCWTVTYEFQAFAALVLNSVTDSIVRFKVLKFSATAFKVLPSPFLSMACALRYSCLSFVFFINNLNPFLCPMVSFSLEEILTKILVLRHVQSFIDS